MSENKEAAQSPLAWLLVAAAAVGIVIAGSAILAGISTARLSLAGLSVAAFAVYRLYAQGRPG